MSFEFIIFWWLKSKSGCDCWGDLMCHFHSYGLHKWILWIPAFYPMVCRLDFAFIYFGKFMWIQWLLMCQIITEKFGYQAIYGELPEFDSKMDQTLSAPSVPSQRPWETIFSGSSHELPPLSKLCSAFLESLLERRTVTAE